jgi:hypothetical protein
MEEIIHPGCAILKMYDVPFYLPAEIHTGVTVSQAFLIRLQDTGYLYRSPEVAGQWINHR